MVTKDNKILIFQIQQTNINARKKHLLCADQAVFILGFVWTTTVLTLLNPIFINGNTSAYL